MRRVRLALLILMTLLLACGPGAETPDGQALYMAYGCAACHGEHGDGNGPAAPLAHIKPRDLRNVAAFAGPQTVEGIASTIAFGVAGGRTGMPAYPDIPKRERVAMARYILALKTTPRGVTASDAWATPSNPAWKIGAAYVRLENHEAKPVTLIAARSPVAGVIEMHEMTTRDGMMSMRKIDSLTIPAHGSVTLAPGGAHLMLIDLTLDLPAGSSFPLGLQFDDGTTLSLDLPVKDAT